MTISLSDTEVRILVCGFSLFVLLVAFVSKSRRFELAALGFVSAIGILAFFNFGLQFHQWSDGFVNRWELYHYQLGSKYFPELGYDGLYSASIQAQRESAPEMPLGWVRDLDTNTLVSFEAHQPKIEEVRERFTDARWQEFVTDHHAYIESTEQRFWDAIRQDHGYNPTPAWTFFARLFDANIGSSPAALGFLASLDIILMVAMFVIVYQTYGFAAACLGIAIAGFGFGWRYLYIGSLLRLDWLAMTVIGICMLKRERFVTAGACIGYAAAVRVFPVLFLLGPGVLALRSWYAGERPVWPWRIAAGFLAVILIGFAGGSMTGRGVHAWTEFAEDIQVHQESWGTNQVGLDTLFVSGPSFLLANQDGPTERRTRQQIANTLEEHRLGRAIASGTMILLLILAVLRAGIADSAVLGMAAIFALTPAASYYWIMSVAVPLRNVGWAPYGVLVLSTGMYAVAHFYPSVDYHPYLYALFAWGNAGILYAWLIPDAVRTIRARNAS